MPRNQTVTVASTWTQITDADVTSITFQNVSGCALFVQPTVGATPPSANTIGLVYQPYQGERNVALADLAPGLAATRVYARFEAIQSAQVWVSHA